MEALGITEVLGATVPVSVAAAGWNGGDDRRNDRRNDLRNDSRDASSTEAGWAQIHKGLVELAAQQAELDYEQGLLSAVAKVPGGAG